MERPGRFGRPQQHAPEVSGPILLAFHEGVHVRPVVILATAALAALTLATATLQPIFAAAPPPVAPNGAALTQSNQTLDAMAARINQDIHALDGDDSDYGGHRIAAIARMQVAHREIAAAEQYAIAHGRGAGAANPGGAAPMEGTGVQRQQGQSDANIEAVKNDLQVVLNQVNADSQDYGGHRVNAARALEDAIADLGKALEYRRTHAPGA
jgi:hypothetical protein